MFVCERTILLKAISVAERNSADNESVFSLVSTQTAPQLLIYTYQKNWLKFL